MNYFILPSLIFCVNILEVVNVNEPHRSRNSNFFESLNNGSTRLSGGSKFFSVIQIMICLFN